MAKTKKYHYYVLVMTTNGPKFITSIDYKNRYSHWEIEKKPMEMSMSEADNQTFGLAMNFYWAMTVKTPYEIVSQFKYKTMEDKENDND